MNCPWCEFAGPARALHAHFGAQHPEVVTTGARGDRTYYAVVCPHCDSRYEHLVRKGRRDPSFMAEFDREIRMVALDMLVHHLVAEHETQETGV
jgi:hypothetical protein